MSFAMHAGVCGRKRVRAAIFEERSFLPSSAACMASSGVRETLGALFGAPVAVRLFEPVIPSEPAWMAIVRDALLYRVRGYLADAAIVLRRADAVALATAAFGETAVRHEDRDRALSPLEGDLLDRTVNALAATLVSVCGARDPAPVERVASLTGFETYFEIALERPLEARIGVALSRDPAPEPYGRLDMDDIAAVGLASSVTAHAGSIEAGELATLTLGSVVPIPSLTAFRGSLCIGGRTLARGTCGVRNGRYAFAIDEIGPDTAAGRQ